MSNGASSFSQKSATQSSFSWNSGSVEKSHAIVFLLRRAASHLSGPAARRSHSYAAAVNDGPQHSVHDDGGAERDPAVEPRDVTVVHADAAVADRMTDAPV